MIKWVAKQIAGFWWLGYEKDGNWTAVQCKGRVGDCIKF